MLGEFIEPYITWNSVLVFLIINIIVLLYHFEMLKQCLTSQATGKLKYVLVTGCDSGFGYNTALELNASRVFVFASCLTDEGVKRLSLNKLFKGHAFCMDVTKDEDVKKTYKLIDTRVGEKGLWCVINNAGILKPGIIDWQSLQDMREAMEVNLWGAVNVTKTMLPLVKKSKGRFVNVTSMAGRVWFGSHTAYSMSKYAFEAFSDGLRIELQEWGISVHIVEPGMFSTPILNIGNLEKEWKSIYSQQPEDIQKQYGKQYLNTVLSNIKETIQKLASPNIKKVTDAICHATLSSNPRKRYVVGFDAWTLWMLIATFPTSIGDFVRKIVTSSPVPDVMKKKKKV